jgi:ribosomal protection tetracycline resistance protein
MNIPRLVFVNKADRAGSDTEGVLAELHETTEKPLLFLSDVKDEGRDSVSVSALSDAAFDARAKEVLAELDDEAADAFLSDEVLPHERAADLVRRAVRECRLIPVLAGAAKLCLGVRELLDFMTAYMPDASFRAADELCGIVFKIEHDKQMGKLSHIRLFGGQIVNRDEVTLLSPPDKRRVNPAGEEDDAVALEERPPAREKVTQIRKFTGGRYADAGAVEAGDIAALCGLSSAKAGQFLGSLELGKAYRLATP